MRKLGKMITAVVLVLVLVAGLAIPGTAAAAAPKNVIVMIADGGGFNEYLAADYYIFGEKGGSILGDFPVQLAMSTYSAGQNIDASDDAGVVYNPGNWDDPEKFMYGATDSAAAASAMSTGTKTYDAGIGVDVNQDETKHMLEDFEELGKATGVVTSVPFCHATPAGFVAHNIDRNNYLGIADEMLMNSATDVIMGGGNPFFNDEGLAAEKPKYKYISETTWAGLVDQSLVVGDADKDGTADPWTLIQTKAEFEALQTGETPERLVGIPQILTSLQEYRDWMNPNALLPAYEVPFLQNVPTLETMAKGALNVLDNDKDGFFLMIEGGAIDWAGHFGQTGRLIEEMADFQNTIEAVCSWVETNSSWDETLLIVTADHETGFLSGTQTGLTDVISNGKGAMPTMFYQLNTLDKKYAGMFWHSNQLVPFYAKGAGAELYNGVADQADPKRGSYLDNTEIQAVIRRLYGINTANLSSWAAADVNSLMTLGLVPENLQNRYTSNINRLEFCTLVFEVLKETGVKPLTPTSAKPMPFTDTTSDAVYTLNQLNIIGGRTGTKFAPNDLITREEAAAILCRAASALKLRIPMFTGHTYSDEAAISSWARDPAQVLYALGVMSGIGGNNFSPKSNFTVQQSIITMQRMYEETIA